MLKAGFFFAFEMESNWNARVYEVMEKESKSSRGENMQHVRGFFFQCRYMLEFLLFCQKFEVKCCLLIFSCTALLPMLDYGSRSS